MKRRSVPTVLLLASFVLAVPHTVRDVSAAVRTAPSDADRSSTDQINIGRAYEAAGRFADAEAAYRKALETGSPRTQADAQAALSRVVRLRADSLVSLAKLLEDQGRSSDAEAAYLEVLKAGDPPKRVVLHKSSNFWHDEHEGFRAAFKDVPVVQLVALAPSSVRLVTHASYPPARGTLLSIGATRHYLFTAGYLPELRTYPGPHIPIPVELTVHGSAATSEIREAAMDALGLGRLNWNTSDLRSSQPVTLAFARRVGGIMAEYGQLTDDEPDPNYRYYM